MRNDTKPNYDQALIPETLKLLKIVKTALKTRAINNKDMTRRITMQMIRTYTVIKEMGIQE